MSATGHGDGRYVLGELEVDVEDGTARLVTSDGSQGSIAGSTLTMARAFEFVVQQVGVSIADAALMAATTPAGFHGLTEVGELTPGRLADVCLVDDEGTLRGSSVAAHGWLPQRWLSRSRLSRGPLRAPRGAYAGRPPRPRRPARTARRSSPDAAR
nr:amidohydrolase family protein [Tessaracoccus coleopterorum]